MASMYLWRLQEMTPKGHAWHCFWPHQGLECCDATWPWQVGNVADHSRLCTNIVASVILVAVAMVAARASASCCHCCCCHGECTLVNEGDAASSWPFFIHPFPEGWPVWDRVLHRWNGVSIGSLQDLVADVVHFLVQVEDMGLVHGIPEQDDVGHVEAVVL